MTVWTSKVVIATCSANNLPAIPVREDMAEVLRIAVVSCVRRFRLFVKRLVLISLWQAGLMCLTPIHTPTDSDAPMMTNGSLTSRNRNNWLK